LLGIKLLDGDVRGKIRARGKSEISAAERAEKDISGRNCFHIRTLDAVPVRSRDHSEPGSTADGPNMLGYGSSLTTILIASVLGIVAMVIPEHITKKIPFWLV
jgi:hypothetical protein